MLKKREWFLIALAFFLTWAVDRYTKLYALNLVGIKNYGSLILSLHFNPGAMLGLFSQLPPVLRVVTLSTGGAFLIFTFLILQYIIPSKALGLRVGMALLLGGIIGNVTDRIVWGHVVDFISFRFRTWGSPVFNLADAIQWIGHGLVMVGLVRHAETFWPEVNTRKTSWVNLRFQLKYCFILMAVGLGIGCVAGTFAYTYLRVSLLALTNNNVVLTDQYLQPFIFSFAAIAGIFMWILFIVGKVISLRVAGPVYAFEKYIEDLIQGHVRPFKLRKSDEFQELNDLSSQIKSHLDASRTERDSLKIDTSA